MAKRISAATVAAIEDVVAAAYDDLAEGEQDWVRLVDLRRYLTDYDREDVDAVLVAMAQTEFVHLAPIAGRSRNWPEEIEAAIVIGGERKQLICIENDYYPDE